jgi:6-hydroxycyclohex-1-ene-1-carbonyl-CoA dehydrogenase
MGAEPVRWVMTGKGRPLVQSKFDTLSPGPDEVLIEIAGCGVCHTDLGYYYDGVRTNHELPLALGHEISGHVIETGDNTFGWIDRAVIVPAVIPCGHCDACRRGKATICPNQKPYQAVVQAGVAPGDLVVVNGVGGVGSYAAQIATVMGGIVVAVDVSDDKLAACASQGAALTLNARQMTPRDLKAAVGAFAKERGLRQSEWIIFECSGTKVGQETAFSLLNRGATLAVVGFTMDKVEVRLSNLMALHARAIGNWGCPPELYPKALELVLNGRVKVSPFVEKHPLDEINQVFEAVHSGALKRRAVLVPAH